jgi:hypothetical protein
MANRLSEEKANAIAAEYMTNGFQKVKALLSVGYKTTYANSKAGLKTYDNLKEKQALERIASQNKASDAVRAEQIISNLRHAQAISLEANDRQSYIRATELLGKTLAMFTDKTLTSDIDKQRELDQQELVEAKRIASIRLKDMSRTA